MSEADKGDSVAIIGAGIAGMSCARVLTDQGLSVTVFEKSRGPGGRMSTRLGQGQWQCDHGAQYFTARHPLFVEQVSLWEQAGVVARWQPNIKTIGRRPDTLATAQQSSPRFIGIPRMTSPARQLAADITVLTNTHIAAIRPTAEGWLLTQEGGTNEAGPFRYLVLAIPAQQAAELMSSLTKICESNSSLTQALASCHKYALRPCWALMLHLTQAESAKSNPAVEFDAAFINPDVNETRIASWIARDNSKPGRLCQQGDSWLLHATPAWSEQHLESDQQQVFATLLSEFRLLTGIQTEVSAYSLHRWRFAQAGNSDDCPAQLWLPDLGLGICGDWLNGGRVEGAWLSGHYLARRIRPQECSVSAIQSNG